MIQNSDRIFNYNKLFIDSECSVVNGSFYENIIFFFLEKRFFQIVKRLMCIHIVRYTIRNFHLNHSVRSTFRKSFNRNSLFMVVFFFLIHSNYQNVKYAHFLARWYFIWGKKMFKFPTTVFLEKSKKKPITHVNISFWILLISVDYLLLEY